MPFTVTNNTGYNFKTPPTRVEINLDTREIACLAGAVTLPCELYRENKATFDALAAAGRITISAYPTRAMYCIRNTGSSTIVIDDVAITPGSRKYITLATFLEHISAIVRLSNAGDLSYTYDANSPH